MDEIRALLNHLAPEEMEQLSTEVSLLVAVGIEETCDDAPDFVIKLLQRQYVVALKEARVLNAADLLGEEDLAAWSVGIVVQFLNGEFLRRSEAHLGGGDEDEARVWLQRVAKAFSREMKRRNRTIQISMRVVDKGEGTR